MAMATIHARAVPMASAFMTLPLIALSASHKCMDFVTSAAQHVGNQQTPQRAADNDDLRHQAPAWVNLLSKAAFSSAG